MNGASATFPTVPLSRGNTRPLGAFDDLKALEQAAAEAIGDFLRVLKWRLFNRIASMAGPLATKYVVKHDKPQLIKSEVQRVARAQQGGSVPPPSTSAGGVTGGKAAKGSVGFASAAKSALARAMQSLAPTKGSGRSGNDEDDADESSITMERYWEPSKSGGGISGSSEDFRKSPNGRLVYG